MQFLPIFAIVISMIIIAISAYIFSILFQVKKQLWYQQKQLDVLMAIASRAGITDIELTEIIDKEVL